jgi:hypothetical protein
MALRRETVSSQGKESESGIEKSLIQNLGNELAKRKKPIHLVFLHHEIIIKMILAPKIFKLPLHH